MIAADAEDAGKSMPCPKCNQRMTVVSGGIKLSCPSCGRPFVAAVEMAMCDCTCPACDGKLYVPMRDLRTPSPRGAAHGIRITLGSAIWRLGALLIVVALIVWGVRHRGDWFSKAASKPEPPPVTVTAAADAVTPDPAPPRSDAAALAAFPDYAGSVRTGDFMKASAQLADLRKTFAAPDEEAAFWRKVIPEGRLRELVLYSPCDQCASGACVRCAGNGACPECNGRAVCPACRGEALTEACTNCLCAPCSGTGKCPICKGAGKRNCPTCDGAGEIRQKAANRCSYCGGMGHKPGLKKADGSFYQSKCVRCNGTGILTDTARMPCPACEAKGTIACPECSGSGKCAVCAGLGRQAACPGCGGTGIGRCAKCGGSKKCPVCQGSGKCPDCQGRGMCRTCDGHGALRQHALIADRAWLRYGVGYIAWDDVNAQIATIGGSVGNAEVTLGSHSITVAVASQQVVCISGSTSFAWCKRQILVK